MLTYLWEATFEDGNVIVQPQDDKYSKHDDNLSHNPSAFRDILDYAEKSPLAVFALKSDTSIYAVRLTTGEIFVNGTIFSLEQTGSGLKDRKVIYFRTMSSTIDGLNPQVVSYNLGYEGKNELGKVEKRIITIYE